MAIDRPKAIDDAPACGPKQSEGRQKGEFLVSRGMGAAQGKKLARRRCGIGDRGAAGLRPDQAIEEAVWETCDQTATKQGELATVVHRKEFGELGATNPSSDPFRLAPGTNIAGAGRQRARPRQSVGLAPPAPPVPARPPTTPLSRRRPDDPPTPDQRPARRRRDGLRNPLVSGSCDGEWAWPRATPSAGSTMAGAMRVQAAAPTLMMTMAPALEKARERNAYCDRSDGLCGGFFAPILRHDLFLGPVDMRSER